jgi:hypothetical protein
MLEKHHPATRRQTDNGKHLGYKLYRGAAPSLPVTPAGKATGGGRRGTGELSETLKADETRGRGERANPWAVSTSLLCDVLSSLYARLAGFLVCFAFFFM